MSPPPVPQILAKDRTHIQCTFGDLFLLYTLGEASSGHIAELVECFDRFARVRTRVGCLIVIGEAASPPNSADREKVARLMKKHGGRLAGLGILLRASGFRAALLRSVAAGLFLLPGHGYRAKFFTDAAECTLWMAGLLDNDSTQAQRLLDFAVEQLSPATQDAPQARPG